MTRSSSIGIATTNGQRRTTSGNNTVGFGNHLIFSNPNPNSSNDQATAAGLSLLARPAISSSVPDPLLSLEDVPSFTASLLPPADGNLDQEITTERSPLLESPVSNANNGLSNSVVPDPLSLDAIFTASAADTPIPRASTIVNLKSCLSSKGSLLLGRRRHSTNNCFRSNNAATASTSSQANHKNEEFNLLVHNVSFSHERVREYEVTLGDNPSVSSGAPISLGWRYNPRESFSSLKEQAVLSSRRRRLGCELKLSVRERHQQLCNNPNVSIEDVYASVKSTAAARLERKESLTELKMEIMKRTRHSERMTSRMKRRRGITDGGVHFSKSMLGIIGDGPESENQETKNDS